MPSKYRIRVSFPTKEEMEEAQEEAKNRNTTVSKLVQDYFRNLLKK